MSIPSNQLPKDILIDVEALYQNAPCGYLSLLPDGTILKVNQTLLRWLDYTVEELLGQKFINLLSKGGKMHFEMFFRPIVSVKGEAKELSYEILKHDGLVLPVLLSATSIKNQQGEIAAINIVLLDITDRKNYEREIFLAKKKAEGEKKRFQFMADQVPEIIWRASAQGLIEYVNERFYQYFDCRADEVNLKYFLAKVHPDEQQVFLRQIISCFRSGKELSSEIRLAGVSGSYQWHLIKAALYPDEETSENKWFGTCTNINAHVTALKAKDEFINIASHELKTPITSLLTATQLMEKLKGNLSAPLLPKLIDQANKSANRVNTLVNDLLNVSQMREGRLMLNKSLLNVYRLVEGSLDQFRHEKNFDFQIWGNKEIEVFADPSRIEQVVVNFVNNAIKYAPHSQIIKVVIESDGQAVKVSVTDCGPGIPEDKTGQLFDRYFQVNTESSRYNGLGLGLYICSEIVKRHNGHIGVESEKDKGSTFWFSLPLL